MCYNKELCEKIIATNEKRLDSHAAEIDTLQRGQAQLFERIDSLVKQLANTNKLLWWVVGIFGTISTGTLVALIGMIVNMR